MTRNSKHIGFMDAIMGREFNCPSCCRVEEYLYFYGVGFRQMTGRAYQPEHRVAA